MAKHLRHSIVDDLAVVTISNPPQNRVTEQVLDELDSATTAIGRAGVRAVLLRAEGDNFSFGGDIMPWPTATTAELRSLFERYMSVYDAFERLPVPIIAAAQGLCLGGGFELILRADVVFATPSTFFGHPEKTLGIVTLLGGIYRVAERAGRNRAMEWALTGERISAKTMSEVGIVNRLVAEHQLQDAALDFARAAAEGPTRAHAAHKALLRRWEHGGVAAADDAVLDTAMPLFSTSDTKRLLPASVSALKSGQPRPDGPFTGN